MIVRFRGVLKVKNRYGTVYYYHRKSKTRLPGLPGSREFIEALTRLNADEKAKPVENTLGTLIEAYRSSPEWRDRAERTKADYQKVFDYLKALHDVRIERFTVEFLYKIRDKIYENRKRRFANYVVQVFRLLFNWAIRRGRMTTNPAIAVELVKAAADAKEANRPWTSEELETVLREAPPELRPGIALGAYVGMREGDVIAATWAIYDGQTIAYTPAKTRRTKTDVRVRAHARLREVLDATKRRGLLIVLGARGRQFTQNGFQSRFFKLLRRLEAENKIGPDLTFHGLRHTLGTLLAEAGCDPPTIASVLGHQTTAMAEHYSRRARRGKLADAAIIRLEATVQNEAMERAQSVSPNGNKVMVLPGGDCASGVDFPQFAKPVE